MTYTQAAAGELHTALLRSDGTVLIFGFTFADSLRSSTTEGGAHYTQIAAGAGHTVLLRSDGSATAIGRNTAGQCNIPVPEAGFTSLQVAAGVGHTVLIRSDGTAIAFGNHNFGQCDIPTPPSGRCFTSAFPSTRVLSAACVDSGDDVLIRLLGMSGEEHCRLVVPANTTSGIVLDRCLTAVNDTRAAVAVIVVGIHDRFRVRRARA